MAEAERVQPEINARLWAKLKSMGMGNFEFLTRTTGCPNGCARPYMAELALVGSGPNQYQLWLGGSPDQAGRYARASNLQHTWLRPSSHWWFISSRGRACVL